MNPEKLKYTEDHLWVAVEDGEARIGITDHAQKELEDVVFVELPEVGKRYAQGEVFGTIESVKSVSDLPAPLSGEVIETNGTLKGQPELVNREPYGQGWLIRIRLDNPAELGGLMDHPAYQRHIQG
jgi:glycine cleavage system H protein